MYITVTYLVNLKDVNTFVIITNVVILKDE